MVNNLLWEVFLKELNELTYVNFYKTWPLLAWKDQGFALQIEFCDMQTHDLPIDRTSVMLKFKI